ncbi:MAG: hypothetical protein M9894_09395 [Planctomycetes bacterium]|nr:hypothetical protein [Planctomycetota bacterium]
MKTVDRVACLALVALALTGPGLLLRAGRELEPRAAVRLAWEEGSGGAPPVRFTEQVPDDVVTDPWGRPFRWRTSVMLALGTDGCVPRPMHEAVSDGPDVDDPGDDVVAGVYGAGEDWPRRVLQVPTAVALALVAWLALAWAVLRRARRRPLPAEFGVALAAAIPAAPVAWAVAHTERVAALDLPQVVPAALAVGLTLFGLAFVAALAVRLASRPDDPDEEPA